MRLSGNTRAWALGALLVLAAGAAAAAEEQLGSTSQEGRNIRITLIAGKAADGSGETQKTYRLVTLADGPPARLLVGWRMPIPTTRWSAEADPVQPQTSYVYQNVGMSADLETQLLGDGRLLVRGMIEISGRKGGAEAAADPDQPPVIGTFQQDLSVVLREGEPLRVAELPDPEGETLFLDLRAEVLE